MSLSKNMSIAKKQLGTYLRLKKELGQFRGIGQYFESPTFDWFLLSGSPESAEIQLIRSMDEGDEWHCDIASFTTINEMDEEEDLTFTGTLDECLEWLDSNGGDRNAFVGPGMIDTIYQNHKRTEQGAAQNPNPPRS